MARQIISALPHQGEIIVNVDEIEQRACSRRSEFQEGRTRQRGRQGDDGISSERTHRARENGATESASPGKRSPRSCRASPSACGQTQGQQGVSRCGQAETLSRRIDCTSRGLDGIAAFSLETNTSLAHMKAVAPRAPASRVIRTPVKRFLARSPDFIDTQIARGVFIPDKRTLRALFSISRDDSQKNRKTTR